MSEETKIVNGEPTPEQIEAWKRKYGTMYLLRSDEINIYARKPKEQEVARFTKEAGRDLYRAAYNIMAACRVYPDIEILRELAKDKPAAIASIAGELISKVNIDFLAEEL